MANRIGFPGTETVGSMITVANFDKLPGGMVAFTKIVNDTTAVTGTTQIMTAVFTAGTSRRYLISVHCSNITYSGPNGSSTGSINIFDVTGNVQVASRSLVPAGANSLGVYTGDTLITFHDPTPGPQTYAFRAVGASSATIGINASATAPAYILVEDCGPTF